LKNNAQKNPQNIAVKSEKTELLYSRMISDVKLLAVHLKSVGSKPGVKVGIILGNCAEYFISFFAISAAGGTIVPLSSKMTTYELTKFIDKGDVSIILTNGNYGQKLLENQGNFSQITIIAVDYDDRVQLKIKTLQRICCHVDNANSDVALAVYTSGTTGPSKLVMLTDDQLISNMFIYRSLMEFCRHNVVYCSLLLHHIYCICAQILTHVSLADTFIITDKPFFIKNFLKAVEVDKVTITAFVPYLGMLMAEFPEPNKYNLESLRHVTFSGAKTPKTLYQTLTERFKHIEFINTYGMSEAGSRISIAAPNPKKFPVESAGKPIPGVQVRIADENDRMLPPDLVGEILVKSCGIMKGYYKQSHLTSETVVNGWLKTGDLGKLDVNGNLYLVGRKKDLIISGGDNIYPVEIEECLLEHPLVLEAAVVGQTDERLQEVPCAFVVAKSDSQVDTAELINFCKQRLSNYKIPRHLYFIKKMPTLGTSKIDRHKLKQSINKQLQVQL